MDIVQLPWTLELKLAVKQLKKGGPIHDLLKLTSLEEKLLRDVYEDKEKEVRYFWY
ncbi:hypothetical protein [Paenibacillus sp. UNC499MF]|uniref:hypothetical protein n=1 Tax=Paenibacillus sp. UNC499MF TaxID=1502751 RepID=UPI00089FF62A|nr:hypothetical protein [Paenibacillus sp. UNC499MF]SEG77283.1 hypothetical protein SAMN02799616_04988 [Paenibacillus sp. UNC499MF]